MKTRYEVARYINSGAMNNDAKPKKWQAVGIGLQDIRCLMDFIYGEPLADCDEAVIELDDKTGFAEYLLMNKN